MTIFVILSLEICNIIVNNVLMIKFDSMNWGIGLKIVNNI